MVFKMCSLLARQRATTVRITCSKRMCSGSEADSYLRFVDSCITQLKASGPPRTCNEEEERISANSQHAHPHDSRCGSRVGSLAGSLSLTHTLTLSLSLVLSLHSIHVSPTYTRPLPPPRSESEGSIQIHRSNARQETYHQSAERGQTVFFSYLIVYHTSPDSGERKNKSRI